MDTQELINEYQKAIVEIYRQEDLQCLSGLDNSFKVKGKQILTWYIEVTQKAIDKYTNRFNYRKNIDDLLFCSDEIMYFTSLLYLYRPFINNPIKDSIPYGQKFIYTNLQNHETKRYYMFADVAGEKIYNYWGRIGDLIASFFPELINPKKVYFPTALEIIPKKYQSIKSFLWLQDFKMNEYAKLNSMRKQIVHYTTISTNYKHRHLFNATSRLETEKWVNDRNGIADYFKKHNALIIEGFYQTLDFLEKLIL